ncbi:clusterin associated protein 1 [Trichuris trichiura]|uniref:Clusterin associated protein 1 n=1 Tax=Trichuris trichiura TaxID=36087 RepID=A0A077ZJX2_TRITR|nr:clusterin associated protein 1 [Trichuris trichiura]
MAGKGVINKSVKTREEVNILLELDQIMLADLKSMLEALNYPNPLSFGSYRCPNFPLTAEILRWLCNCYGDDHDLPKDISTEKNRALFVKAAALYMYRQTGMKLNPRKIYQANRSAIKELLRIVAPLYQAYRTLSVSGFQRDDDANSRFSNLNNSLQEKLAELPKQRTTMSELTEISAAIYDLLSQDTEAREYRSNAMAKQMDITELEAVLRQAHVAMQEEIKETDRILQSIANDEQAMDNKIIKKQAEIDRLKKRLEQLQSVRPAYMNEYESLELEHQAHYDLYVQKFRNLVYLQSLLMNIEAAEIEKSAWEEKIVTQLTPLQQPEEADVLQIRKTEMKPKMFGSIAASGSSEESVTESSNTESEEDDVLLTDVKSSKKGIA